MESQSQNSLASGGSSDQAKSTPARETAVKTPSISQASQNSQGAGSTDNNGQEQVSGLNAASTRQPLEQTLGQTEQLGQVNAQTGAAGKANAGLSSQNTPTQPGQSTSRYGAASGSTDRRKTPEWQKTLQSSLQKGWTSVTERVKTASPTQLALGAAAVGAAVWLGTRKRTPKVSKDTSQSAADRWLDYPTGTAGSRSEGGYSQQYARTTSSMRSQSGSQSQPGQANASGESQTTKGNATGLHGQSNETWQRPTDERWDD